MGVQSPETVTRSAQTVLMAGTSTAAVWVQRAHALGDDLSTEEWALLAELASVVGDWPARNAVVRKALDGAARELQVLAADSSQT